MGFPMGYTDLLFPKLLLQIIFLLGHVRRVISWAFDRAGLGDLVDSVDRPWPTEQMQQQQQQQQSQQPLFRSASALLVEEILPVVRYDELLSDTAVEEDNCAVCLYGLEAEDEVRRLSNCRHVFHRACIDRWMDHDQRTCPLCRTPLIPDDMQEALADRIWAAAELPDSYSQLLSY